MSLENELQNSTGKINILIAAAECAPLAKTGGLADVAGTLPKALAKLGFEARVIIPYHRIIKEKYSEAVQHMFSFYSKLGSQQEYVGIEKLCIDDKIVYLVDNEKYFGNKIYLGGIEEGEQYSFFCRAVTDAIPNLDFKPDIIHCNDWHTAMMPMLAKTQYHGGIQENIGFLLTIHNIAFQGRYDFSFVNDRLGVDWKYYTPEYIELNGAADYLKAGCVFADRINTVSPSYAEEIKTVEYAENLEGILNARASQLSGIINGIDVTAFDPEHDPAIYANYTIDDMSGKAECKTHLQQKLGLNTEDKAPVICMVTRMTEQKGFSLICQVIDRLMTDTDAQFILLGTGDKEFENYMRDAENRWKGRLCAYIGYSDTLANEIYAGSDYYLMPSKFEPCGLSQMIAMRYGTLPIVRETGGLKDTVQAYNEYTSEGNGFSFRNYNSEEMLNIIKYALSFYHDETAFSNLRHNAMMKDFSFDRSADEYAALYELILPFRGAGSSMPADETKISACAAHNSNSEEFRSPVGAVCCGDSIELKLKVTGRRPASAQLTVYNDELNDILEMDDAEDGYSIEIKAPETPCVLWYIFKLDYDDETRYVCPDVSGYRSRMLCYEAEGFRITVYQRDFKTPECLKHGVMYQIFPDRFAFYRDGTFKKGIKYHQELGQTPEMHKSVSEPLKYGAGEKKEKYYPDDFYGGSFKGIIRKLPYLKHLGITCIYLNPICESSTNHRYDTADYLTADPILGSNEDFELLCSKAAESGIRIILDGVFSHTGSDSIYFNADGHYGLLGATQSKKSKYYKWYSFKKYPSDYKCWWGIENLPEVDEHNRQWQKYIITAKDSVINTWMKRGASGWRLDVADEIPDDVLQLIRKTVKKADAEAPIIGEVWEDPTIKVSYDVRRSYALGDALDSVMNYPLRNAVLDFIQHRTDADGLRDFLIAQRNNYPKPMYYSLMNILGTHDVPRIMTVLAKEGTDVTKLNREEQALLSYDEESLKMAEQLEKLCAAIIFSLPGIPCVYYGDEQGMTGGGDPFNRAPFRVDQDCQLEDFYRKIISERKKHQALRTGHIKLFSVGDDVILIFRYINEGTDAFGSPAGLEAFLTVVNRSMGKADVNIDCSFIGLGVINKEIPACSSEILRLF